MSMYPLPFSARELQQIDGALKVLEKVLSRYYELDEEERISHMMINGRYETICRMLLQIFSHDPQILPDSFDLLAFRRDMAFLDQLRPIRERMRRLMNKVEDTELILNDILIGEMDEGYLLVQWVGTRADAEALEQLMSPSSKSETPEA